MLHITLTLDQSGRNDEFIIFHRNFVFIKQCIFRDWMIFRIYNKIQGVSFLSRQTLSERSAIKNKKIYEKIITKIPIQLILISISINTNYIRSIAM